MTAPRMHHSLKGEPGRPVSHRAVDAECRPLLSAAAHTSFPKVVILGMLAVAVLVPAAPGKVDGQVPAPVIIERGSNPEEPDCALRQQPNLRIGTENTPDETVFGNIIAYSVGPGGTIYVLDSTVPAVRVFARDGRYVRTIGRRGRGPGEFEQPYRLEVSGSDVMVFHRSPGRMIRFDTTGTHISTGLVPFSSAGPPSIALTSTGNVLLAAPPPPPEPEYVPSGQIHLSGS